MKSSRRWLAIALAILAANWSSGAEPGGGSITGVVRFTGKMPELPVREQIQDAEICGHYPRSLQSLLVTTNRAVQDVIVYLSGSSTNDAAAPVVLDQRECEFVPRIQIARSGAALLVRNSDPILHVVKIDALSRTNGAQPLLHMATPYAGFEKKYQLANFREPTLLKVAGGNGHEWMTAYIAVLPSSWAAVTDETGRFEMKGVPAGPHKLYAWHEVLGTLTRDVMVMSNRTTTVEFEFGPR